LEIGFKSNPVVTKYSVQSKISNIRTALLIDNLLNSIYAVA